MVYIKMMGNNGQKPYGIKPPYGLHMVNIWYHNHVYVIDGKIHGYDMVNDGFYHSLFIF